MWNLRLGEAIELTDEVLRETGNVGFVWGLPVDRQKQINKELPGYYCLHKPK